MGSWVTAQTSPCIGSGPDASWITQAHPVPGQEDQLIVTALDTRKSLPPKEYNSQAAQSAKMTSLGYLAGSIAHDFNNMLSVIFGYLDILMEKKLGPEGRNALERIREAARRSSDLTRQLLSFIRRRPQGPKSMDLNGAIQDLIPMLTQIMGDGIFIKWQPGKNLAPVNMDPVHMDQILMNLCINARNAMGRGGKIIISTQNIPAKTPAQIESDQVLLSVCDTGCGMSTETQARLFDPFFTTREAQGGAGIGLSTVHSLVSQNKGTISVDSTQGQGTCFNIHLPAHATTAEELPRGNNETLLLVEDEQMILDMGKTMLEGLGYRVLAANSPAAALNLSKNNEIDLIITDIVLPKMGGKKLASRIRAHHPGAKVLYISGYTADIMVHRNTLQETDPFLQKPFSKKELAHRVNQILFP